MKRQNQQLPLREETQILEASLANNSEFLQNRAFVLEELSHLLSALSLPEALGRLEQYLIESENLARKLRSEQAILTHRDDKNLNAILDYISALKFVIAILKDKTEQ